MGHLVVPFMTSTAELFWVALTQLEITPATDPCAALAIRVVAHHLCAVRGNQTPVRLVVDALHLWVACKVTSVTASLYRSLKNNTQPMHPKHSRKARSASLSVLQTIALPSRFDARAHEASGEMPERPDEPPSASCMVVQGSKRPSSPALALRGGTPFRPSDWPYGPRPSPHVLRDGFWSAACFPGTL